MEKRREWAVQNNAAAYPGGGVKNSPGINFGGQILSPGIPTKIFRSVFFFLKKTTKFSGVEFVLPKNLRRLRRHLPLFLYILPYGLRRQPTKIFQAILRKSPKFSGAKFVPCKIC